MDKFKVWVDVEGDAAEMLKTTKRLLEDNHAKQKSKPIAVRKLLNAMASYCKDKNLILDYVNSKIVIKSK